MVDLRSLLYRLTALALFLGFCWYMGWVASAYEAPNWPLRSWLSLSGFFGALFTLPFLMAFLIKGQRRAALKSLLAMWTMLFTGAFLASLFPRFLFSLLVFGTSLVVANNWKLKQLTRISRAATR